jgi:hypothetical protein
VTDSPPPLAPYEHMGRLQADCPACGMAGRITSRKNGLVLFECDGGCGGGSGVYRVAQPEALGPVGTTGERRALDGAAFIFHEPDHVPAVWGEGQTVLWSAGEPFWIVGPQGVGKTTVAQQLALRRAGVRTTTLLGYPVDRDDGKVLYLALDRPRQIARSFRRMVSEDDSVALAERLVVWRGPLPFDLMAEPERLARFAREHDAGTLFIDAAKDMAMDLVKDEVGTRVNHALQHAVADGIEVCGRPPPAQVERGQPQAALARRCLRLDLADGRRGLGAPALGRAGRPGGRPAPPEAAGRGGRAAALTARARARRDDAVRGSGGGRASGGHTGRGERPRRRPRSVRGRHAESEPGREGAAQAGGAGGRGIGGAHPRLGARSGALRRKGAWVAVGPTVGYTRATHAHPRFRFLEHPRFTHGYPRAAHHVRAPLFRGARRVGVGPGEEGP